MKFCLFSTNKEHPVDVFDGVCVRYKVCSDLCSDGNLQCEKIAVDVVGGHGKSCPFNTLCKSGGLSLLHSEVSPAHSAFCILHSAFKWRCINAYFPKSYPPV